MKQRLRWQNWKQNWRKQNHLVSISNFDSEMDGLKKLLDDQQKLHKAKDE